MSNDRHMFFKIRRASGPGRVGSRVLRSLRSLLDSSVREEGAARGGSVGETAAPKSRRSPAEVPPLTRRSASAPKNDFQKRINKCNAFGPQNVAKSIPNSLHKFTKNPLFFRLRFRDVFFPFSQ